MSAVDLPGSCKPSWLVADAPHCAVCEKLCWARGLSGGASSADRDSCKNSNKLTHVTLWGDTQPKGTVVEKTILSPHFHKCQAGVRLTGIEHAIMLVHGLISYGATYKAAAFVCICVQTQHKQVFNQGAKLKCKRGETWACYALSRQGSTGSCDTLAIDAAGIGHWLMKG